MKIAVFGDVHGDLVSIERICDQYLEKRNTRIELVLQIGDFTIPQKDRFRMDKTILKNYDRYINGKREFRYRLVFVKGHLEDFDLLAKHKNGYIDSKERFFYLENGSVYKYELGSSKLNIGGLGGNRSGQKDKNGKIIGKDKYFFCDELKGERRRHFLKSEIEILAGKSKDLDILLLHDSPLGLGKMKVPNFDDKGNPIPTGAVELTELIEIIQPRFAVFGHYHNFSGISKIGKTTVLGLNSVKNREWAVIFLDISTMEFEAWNY